MRARKRQTGRAIGRSSRRAGRSHSGHGKFELGACIAAAAKGAHCVGDVGVHASGDEGVVFDRSRSEHDARRARATGKRARASGARDAEQERVVIGGIGDRDVTGRNLCRSLAVNGNSKVGCDDGGMRVRAERRTALEASA